MSQATVKMKLPVKRWEADARRMARYALSVVGKLDWDDIVDHASKLSMDDIYDDLYKRRIDCKVEDANRLIFKRAEELYREYKRALRNRERTGQLKGISGKRGRKCHKQP